MTGEEIVGMIHHIVGLLRRSAPHPDGKQSGQKPSHPCRTFRERGRILIRLERQDGLSQKELAELLSIRPQSLSELLRKLEQDGMIERRVNEKDRRSSLVYLTEQGRAHLGAIKAARARTADEFLSVLDEEEKAALAATLSKLIEARCRSEAGDEKEKERV